jgi:hypothetical protein
MQNSIKKKFDYFLILLMLIYTSFSLYAQNQLDEKFKEKASNNWYNMTYRVPSGYYGIQAETCYSSNEKVIQSSFDHGLKNEKYNIEVAFAMIDSKPDNSPRGKLIRKWCNPYKINYVVISNEADTILSKVRYLDTLQLEKVNTNRGVIYNLRILNKYKGVYDRCKKITFYKDNVGRAEILFFYNKGDDAVVDEEIKKTWGMLKFKS